MQRPFYSPNLQKSNRGRHHFYKGKLTNSPKEGNTFQERLDRFRIESRSRNKKNKDIVKSEISIKNAMKSLRDDFSSQKMKTLDNFKGKYLSKHSSSTPKSTKENYDQNRSMSNKHFKRKVKKTKKNSPELKKYNKTSKLHSENFKLIFEQIEQRGKTLEEWCQEQQEQTEEDKQTFGRFLQTEKYREKGNFKVI